MVKIAPSILASDFSNLKSEIKRLEKAKADLIHWDVMDGHYVPNLTFGMPVLKACRTHTRKPFDVHLMITNPDDLATAFIEAGANMVSFHIEKSKNPKKLLQKIRKKKAKAGLVVNAKVSEKKVLPFLKYADFILVMSVDAGFGGQKFLPQALDKIAFLARERKKRKLKFLIEVDGGIDLKTAPWAVDAGADILVSGSAIFKSKNISKYIRELRKASEQALK